MVKVTAVKLEWVSLEKVAGIHLAPFFPDYAYELVSKTAASASDQSGLMRGVSQTSGVSTFTKLRLSLQERKSTFNYTCALYMGLEILPVFTPDP